MDNSKELLDKWTNTFSDYLNIEIECNKKLAIINNIIVNLNKLLGNQKTDDLIFYISLINNSHYYLTHSLKILKIKFIKDLNGIWNIISSESLIFSQDSQKSSKTILEEPRFEVLNKLNFDRMIKEYKKKVDNIIIDKNNNSYNIKWVKNDKYENLSHFDNELNETLEYHTKLINQFKKVIDIETNFYNSENQNS